jgi:hypothetical protein
MILPFYGKTADRHITVPYCLDLFYIQPQDCTVKMTEKIIQLADKLHCTDRLRHFGKPDYIREKNGHFMKTVRNL